MKKTLFVASIFLLNGCASIPLEISNPGPLDGAWVLTDLKCENEKYTPAGKEEKEGMGRTYKNLTYINRENTEIFIYNLPEEFEKYPNSRCEIRITEKWKIDPEMSTLTISNTIGVKNPINLKLGACKEKLAIPESRTHRYKIENNKLLQVSLSEVFSTAGIQPEPHCQTGKPTLVYSRVL